MSLENIVDDVIETDILVIGGGVGGPFAALFASEQGARVVLLEKADVRRSGATFVGIGDHHQLLPSDIPLADVAEDIRMGGGKFIAIRDITPVTRGLIDENLVYFGYKDNWEVVRAFEKWGLNMKWDDGQYNFSPYYGIFPDNLRYHGRDIKRVIAEALKRSPVTVLERTIAVDLLTKEGVIAGATALNIRTGQFILCKAKAIVLATGVMLRIFNPHYMVSPGKFKMLYQYHAGSGDGMAMALRAGAELVNMEVSGVGMFVEDARLADALPLGETRAINVYDARGEKIEEEPFSVDTQLSVEGAGRGPCFADVTPFPEEWHKALEGHIEDSLPILAKFAKERGLDTRKGKFEVTDYRPQFNSIMAGVAMGENGQTSLKGLYAVGDMTGGSTFTGVANAGVFGIRAGKDAADNISKMSQAAVDENQVAASREMVFAPKGKKGGVEPLEVEVKIRHIVERYCGPQRSEGSIDQGLWRLRAVRDKFLPELMVRDNHELMSAQEVRNLLLLAEVYMLCARQRKEGGLRTWRLDYPDKANDPWHEASICRLQEGEIRITRRRMPQLRGEFRSK